MERRKDNKGRVLKDGEYQRADGRYEYRWTDSFSGERRSVYSWRLNAKDAAPTGEKRGKSLRELEEDILKNEVNGIDTCAAKRMTVDDLFGRYMALKSNLRETTRALYRNCYNRYIRDAVGSLKVGSVRYSTIKTLYLSLMRDKGLSAATLVPVNIVVHSMFGLAVHEEMIRSNPADGILGELPKRERSERKMKSLTVEQQKRFLEYVMTDERWRRWRLMLTVLFWTGMRAGELFGLVWSDIDFKEKKITVNRSLGYGKRLGESCGFFVNPPKTEAGRRDIPMTPEVLDAFQKEYAARTVTGFCPEKVDGVSGFVFWKDNGNLYRSNDLDKALGHMVEAYNKMEAERAAAERREPVTVPVFSAHKIRHTVASRLVAVESNVKAVQEILGHASATMTLDVYAEAMPEDKTATMQKLKSGVMVS